MVNNMLQANQTLAQLSTQIPLAADNKVFVGMLLALLVGVVIIGGLQSIARITEKLVPFMALLYVGAALFIIFAHIDEMGRVSRVEVRQSLGLGLDEKAIEAIRKWRFRPAKKDGKPVTSTAIVDVGFHLL